MKIPENFKQKYSLTGESYSPKNVDAALSELFSVSGRLYKENTDLKAEIARLHEEAEKAKPAETASVDLSGIEAMISSLESRLDSIRTAVNDTLCVANDAAISAKKAEDAAAEAKASADAAKNAAEDALDAAEAAVSAVGEVKDVAESMQTAVEAIDGKLDNAHSDVIPMIFADDTEAEDTPAEEHEDIPDEIVEEISNECEGSLPEEDTEISDEEESDLLDDVALLEGFEDEPEETAAPIDIEIIEPAPAPKTEEIEIVEESEATEAPMTDNEKHSSFADELIRFAGLDSEPEKIEPAEDVHEDDITSKLAEMYGSEEDTKEEKTEAPAEEEKPAEEKHAPTSFNDMKSALDAIRARLKK